MTSKTTRVRERLSCASRQAARIGLVAALALAPGLANSVGVKVVVNDRGGLLGQRAREIRALEASGERVEIRGKCLSACTMYLKLTNTCIAPQATFGFHGPSWYGSPLSAEDFETFSTLMANHYREPLRGWFMRTARHRTDNSYYMMSGRELIRLGYRSC